MFEGRAAVGYDLGLALNPAYVEGFVEGCLERIGEEYEDMLRTSWEEGESDFVLEVLKTECEVRPGRPPS